MRIVVLQHVPFETPGAILDWARRVGAHIDTIHLYERDALPSPENADLIVVMGGPMSANDDGSFPWMSRELEFIESSVAQGVKILGICLGAQLLARVLGARVYAGEEREVGWHEITSGEDFDGSLFDVAGEGAGFGKVLHWHGETFDLPAGARHLFRSRAYEHQGFQFDQHVLGLQFHMEMTPSILMDVATMCSDDLEPGKYVQGRSEILSANQPYVACSRYLERVLSEWTGTSVGSSALCGSK